MIAGLALLFALLALVVAVAALLGTRVDVHRAPRPAGNGGGYRPVGEPVPEPTVPPVGPSGCSPRCPGLPPGMPLTGPAQGSGESGADVPIGLR